MTTTKTWKSVERRIAKFLGCQRVVCSGVRGEGDVHHDIYHIEIKHRKKIPFYAAWKKTVDEARKNSKTPLVIIHETGSHTCLVIMSLDEFAKIRNTNINKPKSSL